MPSLHRIEQTMGINAVRRSELFLNLTVWVVGYGCNTLLQSFDTA